MSIVRRTDLPTVRLAAALRFFAGGEAHEIAVMFAISHSAIFESIEFVVNAFNKWEEMEISFPTDHARQREIARGFCSKPEVRFGCVVGCINGIVIWAHKPTKGCADAGVGKSRTENSLFTVLLLRSISRDSKQNLLA